MLYNNKYFFKLQLDKYSFIFILQQAKNNIVAKRGSPAFLRNAHSKMSNSTRRRSQFAEIAIKASQDLAQRYLKSYI